MKKREDPVQSLKVISAPTRHRRSLTAQQCTATSKRTGERCRAWALRGQKTCRVHGANRLSAAKAQRVIAGASGFAAEMLVEFMADPKVDMKSRVQIAQDLLNRAGIAGKQQLEIGMQTVSETYARIVLNSTVPVAPQGQIIDAVIVEDDPSDDERVLSKDRLMERRRRQGKQPALPPADERRLTRRQTRGTPPWVVEDEL